MTKIQPLLSAKVFSTKPGETQKNFNLIRFPVACSPKLDGIRLFEYNGAMHTRSLKPVRNYHVNEQTGLFITEAAKLGLSKLDGEITVGNPVDPNVMQNTTSGVMKYSGKPDFALHIFDSYQLPNEEFVERYELVKQAYTSLHSQFPWLRLVQQIVIHNLPDLLAYEEECLQLGYEGIMIRSLTGQYKMGRSTMLEGTLLALKRFVDDEALILEYREEVENANVGFINELGYLERSSHQENLVPKNRMGTMLAKSPIFDQPFWLGGGRGITHGFRQEVWDHYQNYQWQLCTYTYQVIGVKERPRLPKWKSWRSWLDYDPAKAATLLAYGKQYQWSGLGKPGLLGQPPLG